MVRLGGTSGSRCSGGRIGGSKRYCSATNVEVRSVNRVLTPAQKVSSSKGSWKLLNQELPWIEYVNDVSLRVFGAVELARRLDTSVGVTSTGMVHSRVRFKANLLKRSNGSKIVQVRYRISNRLK